MLITASPYWPEPPVCRTNLPCTFSAGLEIVSRYATCGRPTLASTLNSRLRRSTMISRCSSPIPEMSVCPVSSSVSTRKVGSSSANRASPVPSLSWSAFDFGSTATEMTGSGKVIDSSTIGALSAASVSPVVVDSELNALVLERRAEQHRRDLVGERAGPHGPADHLRRHRWLVLDVRREHLVVEVRDRVDQLVVVLLRLLEQLGRDLYRVEL